MEYFRITAYNPKDNYSMIIDSNGMFEKLWQFSSFLINKGFKILAVTKQESIINTNIPSPNFSQNSIILRACRKGKVDIIDNIVTINERYYTFT